MMNQKRSSGILMPVFSLPGKFGIGDIGTSASQFIDFLKSADQQYWQILPMGPTEISFANSPYMSPSAFAGNPLLICPDDLIKKGLLKESEINTKSASEYQVDYPFVIKEKKRLLQLSFNQFTAQNPADSLSYFIKQHPWVEDYATYQALKEKYISPWTEWPLEIKKREKTALKTIKKELHSNISYYIFEQFLFFTQWSKLRKYAHENNIKLIGDLPIYVAADSADVWANQAIFQLHPTKLIPNQVAGVPPDYFSSTGQLWGNPLYKWHSTNKKTKKELWDWWEKRLRHNFSVTDAIRIDHFRGFESYWSIPAGEETAVNGKWLEGPGKNFFLEMEKRIAPLPIIAEDLGIITPAVDKMRKELGYPGMRIILFAFDGKPDNSYLPHNYDKNTVVYTGTHDNDTAVGWFLNPEISSEDKIRAKKYSNNKDQDLGTFHLDLIHLAYASVADTVILPIQDVLGFGNDCRINTPGTIEDNWQWRCAERFITPELASYLKEQVSLYGRQPSGSKKK